MNSATIDKSRISILNLCICLSSLFMAGEAAAQYESVTRKEFSIGVRTGINLTNYAKPFDKVRTNVAKPLAGIYFQRYVTNRIAAHAGIVYTPYTIKWVRQWIRGAVVDLNHLQYVQFDLKGVYRLGSSDRTKIPLHVSGGIFVSRLLRAYNVSYEEALNERYKNNMWGVYRPWNNGISVGVTLEKKLSRQHILGLSGEFIRGLTNIHNDAMTINQRGAPRTRAYSVTLNYSFSCNPRPKNKSK